MILCYLLPHRPLESVRLPGVWEGEKRMGKKVEFAGSRADFSLSGQQCVPPTTGEVELCVCILGK